MELKFLKEPQIEFLREGKYIRDDESPQDRFLEIIEKVREYESDYGEGLADRLKVWIDLNYISLSTPVISNFGRKYDPDKKTQALPASCNIISVGNSIKDIYYAHGEVAMLSKLGAGVGTNYQLISQKNTEIDKGFFSNSKLDWIEDDVRTAQKVSQTNRRGYNTPFIDIMDEDFDVLMNRIDKNNPDKSDPLINNTVGIILPTNFWNDISTNDEYKRRFIKVLEARSKTGKVYILDTDNCNKNSSVVYNKLGLKDYTTNICCEFIQPLFKDMTSVCVISALNLVYWDEISKNPQIIKDAIYFLDIVNEEYVKLTEGIPFLEKAHRGAKNKRDIGLGTLGLAEYFQINECAYGDVKSRILNNQIYSTIRKYAEEATIELGEKLGGAPICIEAGLINRRNASIMMIAPNKSTSFISGATSLGIEPFMSNIFMKSLAKIQYIWKNPHLVKLLDSKSKNIKEVWDIIQSNNGSVQLLEFLSQDEKDIFKTFEEISPKDLIDLAADRQKYIDMGQSLNLIKRPNYNIKDLYDMHKYAFSKGIKTLYYMYPSSHAVLEKDGKAWDDCASCSD